MRSLRFAVTLAAASLLVMASVGIASAAPTAKVASRGLEQRFTAFWTNKPAQVVQSVTYTDVAINGYARFAIQAGSGYAPTGPIMSAGTTVLYTMYHYDGAAKHVTFNWFVSSPAVPRVDTALAYGLAGNSVSGVGSVAIGCVGYGALLRSTWTWTGAYVPTGGWTETGTGQSRACVPTLLINGVAQPGMTSPSIGRIGSYAVTRVDVYPR
jgi:hypothetical protein